MSSTFTIQLHQLRFTAGHGLFAEEGKVQNEFEVNLSLTVTAPEKKVTTIGDTINYAEVYRVVKECFAVPRELLETLSMEIAEELKEQFPSLHKISIQIIKLSPPIASFTGSVSVTYSKKFRD